MSPSEVQSAIEAVIFAAKSPITVKDLADTFCIMESEVIGFLKAIEDRHLVDEAGFLLCNVAGGFIFRSNPKWEEYIENMCQREKVQPLSTAAIETLSIIAYKQPVTKGEIEKIRGTNCDRTISKLCERGIVKDVGRKNVPGRPILYGTTEEFLIYMGLKSLDDLPKLDDDHINEEKLPL